MSITMKPEIIHASCVSVGDAAVLIVGKSGSGKSSLALELMSRGAILVADDRTIVELTEIGIKAFCPKSICGQIEARGVGILTAEYLPFSYVELVVNLDLVETDRLPPAREYDLLNKNMPLLHKSLNDHFAAAVLQYLKSGRSA